MPTISMFYGIIVMLYYADNKKHKSPHFHAWYQGQEAVIGIKDGKVLDGKIPANKMKLVEAWVEIHREELIADWELAVRGEEVFKVEPLK